MVDLQTQDIMQTTQFHILRPTTTFAQVTHVTVNYDQEDGILSLGDQNGDVFESLPHFDRLTLLKFVDSFSEYPIQNYNQQAQE